MAEQIDHLEKQVQDGQAAELLLQSSTFTATMQAAAERIVAEWSREKDPAQREILWAEQRGLLRVTKGLRKLQSDGKVAAEALRVDEVPEA